MRGSNYQVTATVNGKALTFYGNDASSIAHSVLKSRRQNNDPNQDYAEIRKDIENLLSPMVSKSDATAVARGDKKGSTKRRKRKPTIQEAFNASRALLKQSQGDIVNQEEHVRRAKICSMCPARSTYSECWGCSGGGKAARQTQKARAALGITYGLDKRIEKLFCGVCDCSLSLLTLTKVRYKPETQEQQNERPHVCWLRKSSPNYNGK